MDMEWIETVMNLRAQLVITTYQQEERKSIQSNIREAIHSSRVG